MKMLDKNEQSDRPSKPNEKPKSCYCSALPKGFRPVYDDGWDDSFVIDTDAPSFRRLCRALEQHLDVVRKPDGKFPLVYTQEYRMVQAEIKDKC
jgi:hypothetical protein